MPRVPPPLALAMLLLCGCGRPSLRAGGAGHSRPRIRSVVAKPTLRHDLSLAGIARLPEAPKRSRTQGLTLIRRAMAVRRGYSAESGAGAVNAWLDDVEVTLSLSPITIYIPSEYPEGSCEYKALAEHERGHARVAAALAAAAVREMQDAFARAPELPSPRRPVVAAEHAQAIAALKGTVDRVLDPIYARFETELERAQAERDRPAGYERLFERCSGWR
jgi:hypothetical protein